MSRLNVWVPCYDDLDQLREALASTEPYADDIHVYVVDGRYATFEGQTTLTPGADGYCRRYDHITYTHPPELPVGDPDVDSVLRSPQHEQARWVNYELLPEDEWALEMDTDERLEHLDLDALGELNEARKYTPEVLTTTDERLHPAIRLYQPRYWTFWIDDVMFWREFYPRSTPVGDLFEAHVRTAHRNVGYAGKTDAITIRNHGDKRPQEYQQRRADQLDSMGSRLAAQAVRDGKQPALVDLESEYGHLLEQDDEVAAEEALR